MSKSADPAPPMPATAPSTVTGAAAAPMGTSSRASSLRQLNGGSDSLPALPTTTSSAMPDSPSHGVDPRSPDPGKPLPENGTELPKPSATEPLHLRVHRSCCNLKRAIADGDRIVDETPSALSYRVEYESLSARCKFAGYTLSGRHSLQPLETPAPNAYTAPSFLGDGVPKWSISNKYIQLDDPSPGPTDYSPESLRTKAQAPSFSLRVKTGPPLFFTKENPPGCNAYAPKLEQSNVAASLKGRRLDAKTIITPGPANYLTPTNVSTGPHFSMVGRGEFDPADDPAYWDPKTVPKPTPGPASYAVDAGATLLRAPGISLGVRCEMPPPKIVSPGPSAYAPAIGTVEHNDGPRVMLKGRHRDRPKKLPGPADYHVVDTVTVSDLILSLEKRRTAAAEKQAAAKRKAAVSVANAAAAAAAAPGSTPPTMATMGPRSGCSPGPADYDTVPALRLQYKSAPKYSLGVRTSASAGGAAARDAGPAPNAYSVMAANNNIKSGSADGKKKSSKGGVNGRAPPKGASMKSRPSENVMVFPSMRLDTLRLGI
ncbi:hypothetical protein BC828DRAFT_375693 [Blastocladiella britannica]|nr:hypothetical protein BC828DRAFT_375693 [Blastocladiella britannica]